MKIYSIFDNLAKNHFYVFPAVNDEVACRQYAAFCSQNPVVSPDCSLVCAAVLDDHAVAIKPLTDGVYEVMNFSQYLQRVAEKKEGE